MIVNRFVFAFSLFLMTWAALLWGNSMGPPADRSGVSGVTCSTSGCHNDFPANAGEGSVSITGLPAEWTPGVLYPLQVSVSHSGASLYGFQMTAVDSTGAQAGGFAIGMGTAIQSGSVGGKTIEHMQHSFASPNNTFSFRWTAPETSSTGAVRFNVAANAANGNFNQFGDFIYSTETSVEGATLAPADPAAFDALVVGQRMLSSVAASLYHVDFVEAGRFEENRLGATNLGSYTYSNNGPDTGTVVFTYDAGNICTYNVTFASLTSGSLSYMCTEGETGETNWRLVDDPDYVPVTPPETGTVGTEPFLIPDRGGTSTTSSGNAETLRVGYGRIRADAGSTPPSGIAIFQFRDSEGVLISEAGVPAVEPVREGRIFAEVNGPVNTGLAIANPNDVAATVRFYFTDTSGTRFAGGSFELGANQQIAKFLDQAPFNGGPSVLGTFTFTSSLPVAVVALRAFTNEAAEFLMTTLPVAPLSSTSSDTVYFPQFADGNGWATQVILVNPTVRTITGTVEFLGQGSATTAASPAVRTLEDGRTGSSFEYSIPPNGSYRIITSNPPGGVSVGSVRAIPDDGHRAPSGLVIFSFTSAGKTLLEAGVPALATGSAFRVYVESSGTPEQIGSIRTGLAITNAAAAVNTVTLEVTNLDGTLAAPPEMRSLPPSGQVARFIDELFDSLPPDFSGVLRVTSTADVAIVGLRLRINERGELKVTTTSPSNEMDPSTSEDRFFALIVDSAGWSTQFILFSGTAGQTSSGTLSFIDTAGEPWDLPTESSVSEGVPPGGAAVADLVVQSPTVTDASPHPGESFTFSATVRNQGTGQSAATTLRYYRSTDAAISAADTEVGTDAVDALTPAGTSDESISLTAPTTAGTYYYGACVDPVSGEFDTGNNCSNSSMVTVSSASMAGIIPDANLRAAIEAALGKVSGAPITAADMETLTHLTARDAGVSDLTGLEFATNLTELQLDYNRRISDVSPLAGLTSLTELSLRFNTITDVSSLGGLPNLTNLELDANRITDVSVLGGLPNLTNLQLEQNAITDASGVGDLANLVILQLAFNAITDVSLLERLTNLQYLDLQGNPLSLTSINDRLPALERNGITVRFDRFRKGDFDIELVFVGDFIEGQKSVLEYAARRWMSVITEDLPDYEFTQDWSGTCGGQSIEIPAGERIDDLRIYVGSFEDAEGSSGYGGTNLLRESHLPIFGCMTFNSRPGYLWVTASHEVGHVLGFGRRIWGSLGFFQDPDGDQHFNGPLAIAAFDDAGGRDYSGKKVPVEGSHWRYSVLRGELMGPRGGVALSAITVQSLADLGYGVDVTQADAYTLPGAAAKASAKHAAAIPEADPLRGSLASPIHAEPKPWCGLDGEREPIYVVDQLGRIIRTIGN